MEEYDFYTLVHNGIEYKNVPKSSIMQCKFLSGMKDYDAIEFQSNIQKENFDLLLDWMKNYPASAPLITKPVVSSKLSENGIPVFYSKQLKTIPIGRQLKLLEACGFLHCDTIYEILCASVACLIKGKSKEEVFEMMLPTYIENYREFLNEKTIDDVYNKLIENHVSKILAEHFKNRFKSIDELNVYMYRV